MFTYQVDDEIVLRLFTDKDAEVLLQLINRNRQQLHRWLSWVDGITTKEDTTAFITDSREQFALNNGFHAAVIYQGELTGVVGLNGIDWEDRKTELGYWLCRQYQGQGIITRSCRAVIDYIFGELELNKIEIHCAEDNDSSRAVPERLGFTKEGLIREAQWLSDHFVDHIIYGLLRREWKEEQRRQSHRTADSWNAYWGDQDNLKYWQKPAESVLNLLADCDPEQQPSVLDLGCGIGRHALVFARAGFKVIAVDSSSQALGELKYAAATDDLAINTVLGDYLEPLFPDESFDIIISYNVLYHGYRRDFKQAVEHCRNYLKPGGLFFFTCVSRADGKYGSGEEAAPQTFLSLNSIHPGDMHYFSSRADILEFIDGLTPVSIQKREHYWDHDGQQQFSSYWHVLARKENIN